MAKRHFLHRKHERQAESRVKGKPTMTRLLTLLESRVIDRFSRMSRSNIQAVALPISEPDENDPSPNPSHPACAEFSASDYCRESWQLHLAQLKRRPETHWGVCQHERLCAIIPIVCENRCLAVVKLAGPASFDKSEFKRLVEMMELLVRDFSVAHIDFLQRVSGGASVGQNSETLTQFEEGNDAAAPTHPKVIHALEYITAHLFDPRLTVARVASELGLSPTYLSEIFVEQMGQRMSRYIAQRRIAAAKKLLLTTDWQIKRIALETGHANANWFGHVFSVHTGLSPGEFRVRERSPR